MSDFNRIMAREIAKMGGKAKMTVSVLPPR